MINFWGYFLRYPCNFQIKYEVNYTPPNKIKTQPCKATLKGWKNTQAGRTDNHIIHSKEQLHHPEVWEELWGQEGKQRKKGTRELSFVRQSRTLWCGKESEHLSSNTYWILKMAWLSPTKEVQYPWKLPLKPFIFLICLLLLYSASSIPALVNPHFCSTPKIDPQPIQWIHSQSSHHKSLLWKYYSTAF